MREIVFRAYDQELGLSEPFSLNYYPIWNGETKPYWANLCKIEQFTGLTDKNGQKIFEGDIIKRTIHCSYRNDGMAYDVLFKVPGIKDLYGNKIEKDDANNSVDLWETSFEVVGNIHNNPELLS
jgi:uncharacterized phage protein (TIGR01671 family)